jgi:hypothetical protein
MDRLVVGGDVDGGLDYDDDVGVAIELEENEDDEDEESDLHVVQEEDDIAEAKWF